MTCVAACCPILFPGNLRAKVTRCRLVFSAAGARIPDRIQPKLMAWLGIRSVPHTKSPQRRGIQHATPITFRHARPNAQIVTPFSAQHIDPFALLGPHPVEQMRQRVLSDPQAVPDTSR